MKKYSVYTGTGYDQKTGRAYGPYSFQYLSEGANLMSVYAKEKPCFKDIPIKIMDDDGNSLRE